VSARRITPVALLFFVVFGLSAQAAAISPAGALDGVVEKLLSGDASGKRVLVCPEPMAAGEAVAAGRDKSLIAPADGYAVFEYGEDGPSFQFTRYLGYCMDQVMSEKDSGWIIDQMISIEAPEAVTMVEKTMHDLCETEPRQTRRRAAADTD